jgi:hypothetical protein
MRCPRPSSRPSRRGAIMTAPAESNIGNISHHFGSSATRAGSANRPTTTPLSMVSMSPTRPAAMSLVADAPTLLASAACVTVGQIPPGRYCVTPDRKNIQAASATGSRTPIPVTSILHTKNPGKVPTTVNPAARQKVLQPTELRLSPSPWRTRQTCQHRNITMNE